MTNKSDSDNDEATDCPSYIPLTTRRASATDDEDDQQPPQHNQHYSSPTKRPLLRSEEPEGLGLAPESDSENEEESGEEEVAQEEMLKKCEEEMVKKCEDDEEQVDFYVPAYSPYYMHDDRCSDGRSGRTLDQDKPKDIELEGKWPHDKFEELNLQENEYRKTEHLVHVPIDGQRKGKWQTKVNESRPSNLEKRDQSSRIVRGRGPVRYNPLIIARNNITRSAEENNWSAEGRSNTLLAPACHSDKMNSQPRTPTSVLAEGIRFPQQSSACQQGMTMSNNFGHKSLISPVENHQISMPLECSTIPPTYMAQYLQSRDQGWNWNMPYPAFLTDNTMVSNKEVVEEYCRTPYPGSQRLSLKSTDRSVTHARCPAYPVQPAYPLYHHLGLGDSRILREERMKNIRTNRMTGGRPELKTTESAQQKFRPKSQPEQGRYKSESEPDQEKYKPRSQSEQKKYKPKRQSTPILNPTPIRHFGIQN